MVWMRRAFSRPLGAQEERLGIHCLEGLHQLCPDHHPGPLIRRRSHRAHRFSSTAPAVRQPHSTTHPLPQLRAHRPAQRVVKGFETDRGRYVVIGEEDIDGVAPSSSDPMDILEFVHAEGIDPLYFDASYFLVPETAGSKAYHLLLSAMQNSGYSAVAKLVMHRREYTVILRPHPQGILVHTIFYPEEVRAIPEFCGDRTVTLLSDEVQLAKKLIEGLAHPFEPANYRDEYQLRLEQMIDAKRQQQPIDITQPARRAPVLDLMTALRQSLGQLLPAKASVASISGPSPQQPPAPRRRARA